MTVTPLTDVKANARRQLIPSLHNLSSKHAPRADVNTGHAHDVGVDIDTDGGGGGSSDSGDSSSSYDDDDARFDAEYNSVANATLRKFYFDTSVKTNYNLHLGETAALLCRLRANVANKHTVSWVKHLEILAIGGARFTGDER